MVRNVRIDVNSMENPTIGVKQVLVTGIGNIVPQLVSFVLTMFKKRYLIAVSRSMSQLVTPHVTK